MSIQVYDDFLPLDQFNRIADLLCGDNFPWYFNRYTVIDNKEIRDFQFTHAFFKNNNVTSDYYPSLQPLIDKINPAAIVRVKANLTTYNGTKYQSEFHVDVPGFKGKTAVFYLNTNNGRTVFENGDEIESVKNRLVVFDSDMMHTGYMATDTKTRCLLNINFFEWN